MMKRFPYEVKVVLLDLELGGVGGQAVEHVCSEFGPLSHPLHGAFLPDEDASDLLQLLLVPLQIPNALGLQHIQLFLPVLIH